jgi:NAD dependent epimerase/dehydratase
VTISSWDSRKVLVTGAGGFIGSHLVENLARAGADVRALVRYNSRSDIGMLADVEPSVLSAVDVVHGDITDPHQMAGVVAGCDAVFHLAALIGIPYSYVAPSSYVATNVVGTLNLLEAARGASVQRFVQTSTSEVYGSAQRLPMDESHPLHPQSPYAATKVGSDMLAISFSLTFELPAVVVRPFNTYGPRQSARAVIPTILSQLLTGGPVRLGSLDTRRDFTWVGDTADGLRQAAESDVCGEVVNLGSGDDHSIREVAELCARVTGRALRLESEPERMRPPDSEVDCLRSDPGRAKDLFGWTATRPLEEGLRETAGWIDANGERFQVDRYAV